MLNAEKFKKEISECIDEYDSGRFSISKDCAPRFKYCDATYCNDCMLSDQEGYCGIKRIKWLLSEYKEPVKLTRLEYEILKWLIDKDYKYIARDSGSGLYVYYKQPPKKNRIWGSAYGYHFSTCDLEDLFQFVQWSDEEPTSIQEVLENCEVVDDESK